MEGQNGDVVSMEHGVCKWGVGGANTSKLCCSCAGAAMDKLGRRKRGRGPESQIPLSEPRPMPDHQRRYHELPFSATIPQVSSCVAQAG